MEGQRALGFHQQYLLNRDRNLLTINRAALQVHLKKCEYGETETSETKTSSEASYLG